MANAKSTLNARVGIHPNQRSMPYAHAALIHSHKKIFTKLTVGFPKLYPTYEITTLSYQFLMFPDMLQPASLFQVVVPPIYCQIVQGLEQDL